MPHSNQAKKRLRQDKAKSEKNRSLKSSMKTYVKKVLKAVEDKDSAEAKEALRHTMKRIDKAAKKNVIHKKQASRKISRLSKKVAGLDKAGDDKAGDGE